MSARFLVLMVMPIVILSTGCEHLPITESVRIPMPSVSSPATQLVMTTQPCWLEEGGQPVHSGFYCRIYFFNGNNPVPVKVDGELTVLGVDEKQGGTPEKPQGLYRINAEEMARHYRRDVVGHSYVFWFHYPTTEPAEVKLVATFKGNSGKEIQSAWIGARLDPAKKNLESAPAAEEVPSTTMPAIRASSATR